MIEPSAARIHTGKLLRARRLRPVDRTAGEPRPHNSELTSSITVPRCGTPYVDIAIQNFSSVRIGC
jgi:hypothetical protein